MLRKLARLMTRRNAGVLASSVILGCCLSTQAQALAFADISQVYFFGDSLSDSGFNDLWTIPAPLPTGKAPTFTTFGGYVWAQYIARDIKGFPLPVYPGPTPADTITNNTIPVPSPGQLFVSHTLHGIDYAAAGSTTNSTGLNETWAPSLVQQVSYFIQTQPIDPNAVYFIWSGANDILNAISQSPPPSQLQLLLVASTAAQNIADEVGALARAGAKRFVVVSLPNLGVTPLITAQNVPGLPEEMKNVTFSFNSFLNSTLGKVIAQYGVKVLYEDSYDLLNNVIIATAAGKPYVVAGQSFQFVNYTDPACGFPPNSAIYCTSAAPQGYIFADVIHPTDEAHRILSLQVETDILNWQV